MTNHERAQKICNSLNVKGFCTIEEIDKVAKKVISLREAITSQLDEAVREARDDANDTMFQKAYQTGFAAAREKAAGKVPTNWLDAILSGPDAVDGKPTDGCPYVEAVCKRIIERIRTMEPNK